MSIWLIIIKGSGIMIMKNPPHPGSIVRFECLDPLGLSVPEAAKVLGVTRQALNNLVGEKAGISAEMAVRLAKAFGSSPDMWLRLQVNYDLAQVEQIGETMWARGRFRHGPMTRGSRLPPMTGWCATVPARCARLRPREFRIAATLRSDLPGAAPTRRRLPIRSILRVSARRAGCGPALSNQA